MTKKKNKWNKKHQGTLNNKQRIIIAGIAAFIIFMVFMSVDIMDSEQENKEWNKPFNYEYHKFLDKVYNESDDWHMFTEDISGVEIIDCPESYHVSREDMDQRVFCQLPKIPIDFFRIRDLFWYQKLTDYSRLTPEYYKQPEFFPNYGTTLKQQIQSYDGKTNDPFGYSVFPVDTVVYVNPGDTVKTQFFIMNSMASKYYKLFKLRHSYPPSAQLEGVISIYGETRFDQDVMSAKQAFTIDFEPNEFLLEPSFPIFFNQTTVAVQILFNISEDAKPGVYFANLEVTRPGTKEVQEYRWRYLDYLSFGDGMMVRPQPQFWIVVTEVPN